MAIIDSEDLRFSFVSGTTITLRDGDLAILVWASGWTGKEIVRVDGQVVSTSRTMSKSNDHRFKVGDIEYRVTYETKRVLDGHWGCSLFKGDELVDEVTWWFEGGSRHVGWASIGLGLVFGIVIVGLPSYLHLTIPTFVVVLLLLNRFKRHPVFEWPSRV